MKRAELDCIVCPASCRITVELSEEGRVVSVSGNGCRRGAQYAGTELTAPVRMVTGTVPVEGGLIKRLPVVTSAPVPKERIFDVMKEIHHIHVCAPVAVGDIIRENLCGLGVELKAARTVGRKGEP